MSTTSAPQTAPKTRSFKSECCTDPNCGAGLRNRYFLGKQLSPDSFQVEQRHTLERRRLLNRAIHGWGVVYGYEVARTPSGSLTIKSGLALDENGRELLQAEEVTFAADELIVLDEKGEQSTWDKVSASKCWLLSAHYAEQDTDKVKVSDACHCEHWEWNYTCETVRYSLQSKDCAKCCDGQRCEWQCECGSKGWCDQFGGAHKRGGRCLCDHVTMWSPGSECDSLCEIDEPCGSVCVDLRNGVPLACVKLVPNNCDGWAFGEDVDACGPRQLVKRNDLLFDLIQGCDLTKIIEIGWGKLHRQGEIPQEAIPFDMFSNAIGIDCQERREHQSKYVTRDFWVKFSQPVSSDSLRPDCFAMTIMSSEREGGWWQTFRAPIIGVDTTLEPPQPGDPEKHVRSARIVVDGAWAEDAVCGPRNIFQDGETHVEIEVRGDFIIDCNGQAVDANAVGLSPWPTGNGMPGGTFLSTFRVAPAPPPKR